MHNFAPTWQTLVYYVTVTSDKMASQKRMTQSLKLRETEKTSKKQKQLYEYKVSQYYPIQFGYVVTGSFAIGRRNRKVLTFLSSVKFLILLKHVQNGYKP